MNFVLEFFVVLLQVLWYYLESAFRCIVPVPRKRIDGEIALITGGGGKIGECVAAELAKENAKIVLWDVNEKACESVASKLRKDGVTVFAYQCDLTDKDQVYSLAKKVEEEVGHVTILVNNAGVFFTRPFLDSTDKELETQVQVNTIAHFWTTKAFLPHMLKINHGHIVTVSSTAGLFGIHNCVGYSTSKFGAWGFHDALTVELVMSGKTGVKTTCLCPLFVNTPLIAEASARFSLFFHLVDADYVARDLVDGMLRNKNEIVQSKLLRFFRALRKITTEKAARLMYKYSNFEVVEGVSATLARRREQDSLVNGKKTA